jgi:hypothetical protein
MGEPWAWKFPARGGRASLLLCGWLKGQAWRGTIGDGYGGFPMVTHVEHGERLPRDDPWPGMRRHGKGPASSIRGALAISRRPSYLPL